MFSTPEHKAYVYHPSTIYIFDFLSRTSRWIFMKLGVDEVLMMFYKCCCLFTRSA